MLQLNVFTASAKPTTRVYDDVALTRMYNALHYHGITTSVTLDDVLNSKELAQELVTAWYCELVSADSLEALNSIQAISTTLTHFKVFCQWDWLAAEFE